MTMQQIIGRFSSLGAAFMLFACGSAQLSQTKLGEVQSTVSAAEAIGARDQPKAALHLSLANDQVAEARRLAAEGDGEGATLLLDRARVDAELALQLARTEGEQAKAREAWQKVRDFEKQGESP
jgi:hypothetical protein